MTPKELKNIAPRLFELKTLKNGFCAPKKYFNSIDKNVMSSIFLESIEQESAFEIPDNYLNEIESTVFEKIKIENHSIPENYFDTIEDLVFDKIKSETKVISFKQRVTRQFTPIAVAASIALFFTFQYFYTPQNNDFASIKGDDIELWLNNGELNFNDIELAYLYEDTELESVSVFDFYEEEEVFNYLNELDVESLILTN